MGPPKVMRILGKSLTKSLGDDPPPAMETQMANEMETGIIQGFMVHCQSSCWKQMDAALV